MAICYAETEGYEEIRVGCIRNGVSNFMFVMLYVKAKFVTMKNVQFSNYVLIKSTLRTFGTRWLIMCV
jgi:hypothetical protein